MLIKTKTKYKNTLSIKNTKKVLINSIPIFSIFTLIGIIINTVMLLTSPLTNEKTYAADGKSETIGDSTASITISGAGREEVISAGRGSVVYRTHDISMAGSNVRNYTLSIYGDSNLKYVGSGTSGSSNDTLTSANGKAGSNIDTNTWGYGYGDSTTSNDNLTYKAPTGSTIGTAETLASGTIASSDNGVLSISNKKLVFAAKFSEDKPQGNYRANVNLALTITPRVLTTYSITYSGNGNTGGSVPAKQSIDLYDTTSYNGFIAAANTGNLTKTGYNFLGWAESSSATAATYTAGSSTVSLTSSKPEITLYAVWEKRVLTLKDITKMQEMTADICKASSVGDVNTLTDTRDDSKYSVKKLNSEQCWMTQNLRLTKESMATKNTTLTTDNSDIIGTPIFTTLPTSSMSGFADNAAANAYYNTTYGAYYSWCAATVNTCKNIAATDTNAASSICPKGWHLPVGGRGITGVNTGIASDTKNDFMIMAGQTSTSGGLIKFTDADGGTIINGITWPYAGNTDNGGFYNSGGIGYYWSRTPNKDATDDRVYHFGVYAGGSVSLLGGGNGFRRYGLPVRCVAYSS